MRKDVQPIDLSTLNAIRARERARAEINYEIRKLEKQIRAAEQKTHLGYLEQLAKEAGVNLEAIREDARRRNRVKQRTLEKGYEEIRAKAKKLVHEEAEHLRSVRQAYIACHKEAIKARQGNPELKFVMPVEGGDWWEVEEDPPGGLVGTGCREPIMAERHYSHDMEVGGQPPEWKLHRFYPRAYARTGDDDEDVWVKVHQAITLHSTLDSGRGNFHVDRVRVNLSGVGHSHGREGDPPFGTGILGHMMMTCLCLDVTVMQTGPSGLMQAQPIQDQHLHSGYGDHIEAVPIELGSTIFPCDFDILNPDEGGSEPWVYLALTTSAFAGFDDARAEIDFSRPDYDGLELGCVSFFGEYV